MHQSKSLASAALAFLFFIHFGKAFASDAMQNHCEGIFSAKAEKSFSEGELTPKDIWSPNGQFSIKATTKTISMQKNGEQDFPLNVLVNPALMEVVWNNNSQGFAINLSDGGLVGTWEPKLFTIGPGDVPVEVDLRAILDQASKKYLRCSPEEEANWGVLTWLRGDILVAAEVPPHSSCKNMGQFFGFRVSLKSKKVIEVFSEKTLRTKWKEVLECRFY
ncbi:hypothetical protein ACO0LF_02830 [Undibacterium sp. Di27W]|uniref:hypothetical protein n=1 Tax=Undibacterium sp. Di27W TaxID=3413036 RepID=UPI003BEFEF05